MCPVCRQRYWRPAGKSLRRADCPSQRLLLMGNSTVAKIHAMGTPPVNRLGGRRPWPTTGSTVQQTWSTHHGRHRLTPPHGTTEARARHTARSAPIAHDLLQTVGASLHRASAGPMRDISRDRRTIVGTDRGSSRPGEPPATASDCGRQCRGTATDRVAARRHRVAHRDEWVCGHLPQHSPAPHVRRRSRHS